jgi:hypothetical protein
LRTASPPPVCLRALRFLGGAGAAYSPAEAPLSWSDRGSLVGAILRRVGGVLAPIGPVLDRVAAPLLALPMRALLFVPVVIAGLRLLGDWPAVAGVVTVLFAVTGLTVLLKVARVLHPGEGTRTAVRLLLLGAVLRLVFGAVIAGSGGLPDEIGYYHPLAEDTAACWANGAPSLLPDHRVVAARGAYYLLLSGAYYLAGPEMLVGRVLGALLSLAAALLAGELARCLAGPRAAVIALGLLALNPVHAFWSTTLSRDSLTTIFVLAGILCLARRPGRTLPFGVLLAAMSVMLLFQSFFLAAVALGGAVVVIAAAEMVDRARGRIGTAGAVLAAGALFFAAAWFVLDRYGMWLRLDVITAIRQAVDTQPMAEGNPTRNDFLPDVVLTGPLDLLGYLPIGAAFVLFAPFPWIAVHTTRFLYSFLMVPGLAITVFGLVGMWKLVGRGSRAVVAPVLFSMFFLLFLALLEGSSGIVARHRLPLTAVLVVGAAAVLAGLRREESA